MVWDIGVGKGVAIQTAVVVKGGWGERICVCILQQSKGRYFVAELHAIYALFTRNP
jgi:hypothetical protein